jgi:hypothetical protein
MRLPKFSPAAPDLRQAGRVESARALQRRLDEIECFRGGVQTRQLARLLRSYPSVQLLPEWLVGDSWLGAHEAELRLQAQLADLERRTRLE